MHRWLLVAIAFIAVNAAACGTNREKPAPIRIFSDYAAMQSRCIAAYDKLLTSSLADLASDETERTVSAVQIYERLPGSVQSALRNPSTSADAYTMEERLRLSFGAVALCEKDARSLEVLIFADRLNSRLRQWGLVLDSEGDASLLITPNANELLLAALVNAAQRD